MNEKRIDAALHYLGVVDIEGGVRGLHKLVVATGSHDWFVDCLIKVLHLIIIDEEIMGFTWECRGSLKAN